MRMSMFHGVIVARNRAMRAGAFSRECRLYDAWYRRWRLNRVVRCTGERDGSRCKNNGQFDGLCWFCAKARK